MFSVYRFSLILIVAVDSSQWKTRCWAGADSETCRCNSSGEARVARKSGWPACLLSFAQYRVRSLWIQNRKDKGKQFRNESLQEKEDGEPTIKRKSLEQLMLYDNSTALLSAGPSLPFGRPAESGVGMSNQAYRCLANGRRRALAMEFGCRFGSKCRKKLKYDTPRFWRIPVLYHRIIRCWHQPRGARSTYSYLPKTKLRRWVILESIYI
jgi:hypothetical protein